MLRVIQDKDYLIYYCCFLYLQEESTLLCFVLSMRDASRNTFKTWLLALHCGPTCSRLLTTFARVAAVSDIGMCHICKRICSVIAMDKQFNRVWGMLSINKKFDKWWYSMRFCFLDIPSINMHDHYLAFFFNEPKINKNMIN